MKSLLALVTALPIILSAGAALAAGVSYTGNWPITVTHSQHSDGTYCLEVTDDGSLGWPHSGLATLEIDGQGLFGTFQLIGQDFTVTNEDQGFQGQNAGLVFMAHAANGTIGKGVYDEVYGGEEFDSGVAAFGAKGGC